MLDELIPHISSTDLFLLLNKLILSINFQFHINRFLLLLTVAGCSQQIETEIADFRPWSMKECGEVFKRSLIALRQRVEESGPDTVLIWDKVKYILCDIKVFKI